MQSLWTTTRQSHRLGCKAYSTTLAGLGRRVTNAPRPKATLTEISTACYSSVLASATLIDAVAKEEQRWDLDPQLENTGCELNELRGQHAAMWVESSIKTFNDRQLTDCWTRLKDIYDHRPYYKEMDVPPLLSESVLRASLQRDHYNCPKYTTLDRWMRSKSSDGLRLSSAYEETSSDISQRNPLSSDHLENFGDQIRIMVRRLLGRAKARTPYCDRHSNHILSPSYDEAERLLDAGYPYYQLRSTDDDLARLNTIRMNQANKAAIQHAGIGIMEKAGRVCYNLLISAYPPDIHTFNSLIIEFDAKNYSSPLSEVVVFAFFYHFVLKPTPTTFAAILYHYNVTRNHGMLMRTIGSMVGLDGRTGAKVKGFHIDQAIDVQEYNLLAQNTWERTLTREFFFDHLPLNRLVIEETIRGLLRFHVTSKAVSLFADCLQTRVRLTKMIIKQVLDGCLMTLDWLASEKLLQELIQHEPMWAEMIRCCDDKAKAYVIDRVYSIMDLMGLGESAQSISEKRLNDMGITSRGLLLFYQRIQRTNDLLPEELMVLPQRGSPEDEAELRACRSRMLRIESLWKESIRIRKITLSIESKLTKFPISLDACISMAHRIGVHTLERCQLLCYEAQESLEQWDAMEQSVNLEHSQPSTAPEKLLVTEKATYEKTTHANMPLLAELVAASTGNI